MYVGAHHTGFKGQLCGLSSPLPPFCGFSAQIQVARITLELTVQTRQASATLCAGIKDKHCHAQLVSLEPNTHSGMWAQVCGYMFPIHVETCMYMHNTACRGWGQRTGSKKYFLLLYLFVLFRSWTSNSVIRLGLLSHFIGP